MAQGDSPKSHGTRCMTNAISEQGQPWQNYLRRMQPSFTREQMQGSHHAGGHKGTGRVNPRPNIHVVADSPTSRVYDGDGGLGQVVCAEATSWAIATAKRYGSAVCTTRNHFHVGATGFYSRMAVRENCIAIVMSSHRSMAPTSDAPPNSMADFGFDKDTSIAHAALDSPMSIGVPANSQPPLVFDGSVGFGIREDGDTRHVLKQLGLQAAVVALGGVVAGVYQPETLGTDWEANQGCFISVFDAAKLLPSPSGNGGSPMDPYVAQATGMQPIAGLSRSELPGGDQVRRIAHCEKHGIEIEPLHASTLVGLAQEFGVAVPPALSPAAKL